MTRFQDVLLAELVTHVEARADDAAALAPSPRETSRVRRRAAAVAVTALVAALLAGLAAWLTPSAAYAFTEYRDGTITITFHDLTDAGALNRDLRAHGADQVRAISVDELPACSAAAQDRPGNPAGARAALGADPAVAPWGAYRMSDEEKPVGYFFFDHRRPDRRVARQTRNALTIDPTAIPPGQVLVVVVMDNMGYESHQTYADLYLLAAPGPNCMVGGHQR